MPADGCLFCGRKPLSVEHVIPNWLGKLLPVLGKGPAAGYATGRVDLATPDEKQFFIKRFGKEHKTPFEAKRPCEKCNSEWMSDLENQAKPWLTPMIQGRPVKVPAFALRWLATWCIKTMTFFRYSDSPPAPTPDYRNKWLFKHKTPPPGSFVFLARYRGESVNALVIRNELIERSGSPDVSDNQVHFAAVRLGDLAFLVVEVFSGNEATLRIPEEWRPALIRVWPNTAESISWPPPRSLTDAGVRSLVHIFDPPDEASTKTIPKRSKRTK